MKKNVIFVISILLILSLCSCDVSSTQAKNDVDNKSNETQNTTNNEAPCGIYTYTPFGSNNYISITFHEDGIYEYYESPWYSGGSEKYSSGSYRIGDNNSLYFIKDGKIDDITVLYLAGARYDKSADVIINDFQANSYYVYIKEENQQS